MSHVRAGARAKRSRQAAAQARLAVAIEAAFDARVADSSVVTFETAAEK
jgi:hypothetical protein